MGEKYIITNAERARNLEIIEKCKRGLFFIYVNRKHAKGGCGYGTLVFNGREVALDGTIGKTLTELNDEKWCLDIDDDGREIPAAFLPTDLIEMSMFNQWK